jgi:6-phosphogluconolactonase
VAEQEVLTHPSPEALAAAVAGRLVAHLAALQAAGRVPSVVLTGGSIAAKVHEAVVEAAGDDVDWSRVEVWFGDERFVPADDPERNAGQAAPMLDRLRFDPGRVHVMPSSDGPHGDDVDAAAGAYADELARAAGPDQDSPRFDVLMLGIGPDGHCASLFPGRTEVDDERLAVAVRDSPKPPPTRITMTGRVLGNADEVWWVAAGPEKAEAVANAVRGADVHDVPAAGPRGLSRTLWLLDEAAAGRLP